MRAVTILFLLIVSVLGVRAQTSSAKWKVIETEGDTLLDRQDFKGAIEKYNKVVEISKLKDPESKGVLYKRAICFYSIGEFQKALDDLEIFIPQYPLFPRAKLLRIFVNRELRNTEAQLKDINELLSINPTNPDLLKLQVSVFLETEKYPEAKKALLDLQKVANDEEIETQLGFIYSSLNDPDSAFMHFESALNINAGYAPAYMYISSVCLDQEAFELALTYIDLGLRLEPENSNLLFYKGIALAETDNLEEGCRLLSRAFYAGLDQAGDYLKQYCYSDKD